MRYIQCPTCHKLIEAHRYDEHTGRTPAKQSAAVHEDIAAFVSPVDGSVISSRTALRDHNARHGVISQAEYGDTHNRAAQKRREDFFLNRHSKEEKWRRKAEIHEAINRLERK